jgi:hypothetical protein
MVGGCSRFSRTKQCRTLIAQVNPALDEVVTLTHGGAGVQTGGNYIAAAGRYERLAKQLGPLEFATEDMAKSVAEYAALMTSAAQSLRALASALDTKNIAEAERLNHELERTSASEHAVIARMNAWCQP